MKKTIMVDNQEFEIDVKENKNHYEVEVDGETFIIDISNSRYNGFNSVLINGQSIQTNCQMVKEGNYQLTIGHHIHEVMFREAMIEAADSDDESVITAPMPGLVVEVKIALNDKVEKGQTLIILEAMKLFNEITAKADGIVSELHVKQNDTVSIGQKIIVIESEES